MSKTLSSVQEFRKILKKSLFLTDKENKLYEKIPDAIFEGIFRKNFNSNLSLAERVVFNRYKEIAKIDRPLLESYKTKIYGLEKASKVAAEWLAQKKRIVFLTDNDNDGSVSQALLIEFYDLFPQEYRDLMRTEYVQHNHVRGINAEHVEKIAFSEGWNESTEALLITADNGVNNQEEIEAILQKYPKLKIIITDHHMPNDKVVQENGQNIFLVNPKYQPIDFFKKKNISGANTIGVFCQQIFKHWCESKEINPSQVQKNALENIEELGLWGNLIDYVEADIADMPLKNYTIETIKELGPLLNAVIAMASFISSKTFREDLVELEASTGIDVAPIRSSYEKIQGLNEYAHQLLNFYRHYVENAKGEGSYTEKDFYVFWAQWLEYPKNQWDGINENYIEQLRPIILNLRAVNDKDPFASAVGNAALNVFIELKSIQREISNYLRDQSLVSINKNQYSTIMRPVAPEVGKLFNRRFLGTVYNQENNGFFLVLGNSEGEELVGSMRSKYKISDLLKQKIEIEDLLNIKIEVAGHEKAAGFKIKKTKPDLDTNKVLDRLNEWMALQVGKMALEEKITHIPFVKIDFSSVGLITKINAAIKANLAGMHELPALLDFEAKNKVFITDAETTEQINLKSLVEQKKYGYQPIKTDFDGGAFIAPIELLRSVVDSNYQKMLRLSYLNEGVFMASQTMSPQEIGEIYDLKGGRKDKEELKEYLDKVFPQYEPIEIDRNAIKSLPYFKFNTYGEAEFELFEALMIDLLEETRQDKFAVIDTEGTGLGRAPKCFNIGGVVLGIDEESGLEMATEEFIKGTFRTFDGKLFYLSEELRQQLKPIKKDKPLAKRLWPMHVEEKGLGYEMSDELLSKATPVKNWPKKEVSARGEKLGSAKTIRLNRTVKGHAFAYLIKNNDFAITKEFEDLTGVDQRLVDEKGIFAEQVDGRLVTWFEGLKNKNGEPAKIIFSAHNLPYDKGVITSNLPQFNELMDAHVLCDTAKIAREAKLSYDETPVCHFEGVDGLDQEIFFYDSPHSDYSMSVFLERARAGKGGLFPDINGKVLLRYTPETERFSLIHKGTHDEVILPVGVEDLWPMRDETLPEGHNTKGEELGFNPYRKRVFMPNRSVKFSVESMSMRAMIRNIILHNYGEEGHKIQYLKFFEHEKEFEDLLNLFQKQYHFDASIDKNIEMFRQAMSMFGGAVAERTMSLFQTIPMEDFAIRFLNLNKDIQAKFHDGWIYQKVLSIYEPSISAKLPPKDIIEQIRYYTDLPLKKVKEVLTNTIEFKRKFGGLKEAIVHEQHNNLRFSSADGQGLADAIYEAALPQALAGMKFYSSYNRSHANAVARIVNANIKDSNAQIKIREQFNSEKARDSYSFKQMLAFSRNGAAQNVKDAKKLAKTGAVEGTELADIKFNLTGKVIPDDSAVYASPKKHIPQEEIEVYSEKLANILIHEQILNSLHKIKDESAQIAILNILEFNKKDLVPQKNALMEVFNRVEFSRKPGKIKKIAAFLMECFDNGPPEKWPRSIPLEVEFFNVAQAMRPVFENLAFVMNEPSRLEDVDAGLEMFKQKMETKKDPKEKKSSASADLDEQRSMITLSDGLFLPQIDFEKDNPIKTLLELQGPVGIGQYLSHKKAQRELRLSKGP